MFEADVLAIFHVVEARYRKRLEEIDSYFDFVEYARCLEALCVVSEICYRFNEEMRVRSEQEAKVHEELS